MKTYTVKEVAFMSGITVRKAQRICVANQLPKRNGKYVIYVNDLPLFGFVNPKAEDLPNVAESMSQGVATSVAEMSLQKAIEIVQIEAAKQEMTYRVFTQEEYDELQGELREVDLLREQVQYLRNRVEKQDGVLEKLQRSIEQSNYLRLAHIKKDEE